MKKCFLLDPSIILLLLPVKTVIKAEHRAFYTQGPSELDEYQIHRKVSIPGSPET